MSTETADNTSNDQKSPPAQPKEKAGSISRVAALIFMVAAGCAAISLLVGGIAIAGDEAFGSGPTIDRVPPNEDPDTGPAFAAGVPERIMAPPVVIRTTESDRNRMAELVADHIRRSGGNLLIETERQRAYITQRDTAEMLAQHARDAPDEGRVRPEQYSGLRDRLLGDGTGPADTMVVVSVRSPAFENPLFLHVLTGAAFGAVGSVLVLMTTIAVLGLNETYKESRASRREESADEV